MGLFVEGIRELRSNAGLPEELEKNLYTLLGSQLAIDKEFLLFAEQADDDCNINLIKSKVNKWEAIQDIARIEALASDEPDWNAIVQIQPYCLP
jgi:hypothetical protein